MNRSTLLLGLGSAVALLLASLAWAGDLAVRTGYLLAIWSGAHALYLAACWIATRTGPPHPSGQDPSRSGAGKGRLVALILAIGLIPRLALLPTAPTLSEDLYRYLWDGRLTARGVNPYAHPPSDPALAPFRAPLFDRLNHPDVRTIYPPGAQLLFAAAARLGSSPGVWKAFLLALECLLVAGLARLLARRVAAPERLLLYYWNPLVIVECYGSGHVDLAAAALLVAAVALFEARRPIASGLALGIGVAIKLFPALLLLPLLRRKAWSVVAIAAWCAALLALPFAGAGGLMAEGLRTYARHWEFNGPLYALARHAFPNGDGPRLLLVGLFAAAALVIAWRARTPSGAMLGLFVAFLLTSPTVYPWYLVPAVALLPLHPDAGLLLFSGLVPLTYLPLAAYRATGVWDLPTWVVVVEYGATLAVWGAAWTLRSSSARAREARAGYGRRAACTIESTPT